MKTLKHHNCGYEVEICKKKKNEYDDLRAAWIYYKWFNAWIKQIRRKGKKTNQEPIGVDVQSLAVELANKSRI